MMFEDLKRIHNDYQQLIPIFQSPFIEEFGFTLMDQDHSTVLTSVGISPFEVDWFGDEILDEPKVPDQTYFQGIIDYDNATLMMEFTANQEGFLCRALLPKPGSTEVFVTSNEMFIQFRHGYGLFGDEHFAKKALQITIALLANIHESFQN